MKSRLWIVCLTLFPLIAGCTYTRDSAEVNYQRGNRFFRDGLAEMAVQAYERALTDDDQRPEIWNNLGLAQLQSNKPEKAARSFRNAVALQDNAEAWYNLGVAELAANNPRQAAEALNKAVTRDLKNVSVWNNLGVAYQRMGRFALAQEAFQKTLRVEESNPAALNNLAWLYLNWEEAGADRLKKALDLARKAESQTGGKDAKILATLAEAEYFNRDPQTAVRVIQRALALEPGNRYYQERLNTYRNKLSGK